MSPTPRDTPALNRPDPSDDGGPASAPLAAVLLGIAVLLGVDLLLDRIDGRAGLVHLALEGAASLAALGLGTRLLLNLQSRRREILRLQGALRESQAEAERWRRESAQALQGLGQALDVQFERWGLTPAEREVALLLLKGFSTREIAGLRSTSERTARQQAQDVYRKGGLAGRAELSAFFLEDLLLPPRGD